MKYYGTKNNKDFGFYLEKFDNAIEITDEYWMQLLKEQTDGKIIIPFEGNVIAVNSEEYIKTGNTWNKLAPEEIKINQLKIQNAIREEEIKKELEEIDKKRIRAIAEPALMDSEITWLEYYTSKAVALRNELAEITK